jgi:UDP-2,3-diacylglucosamine pyrophosphatase LpxH
VERPCNLLVASDLHLSEGWDPETGRTSRLEDFFHDEAFARFLRYHEEIKHQPRFARRPWLLILNGDLFDFLQVVSLPDDGPPLQAIKGVRRRIQLPTDQRDHGLGTTPAESAWKLQRIARGHRPFFAALGWFVARGNRVAVVRGNHDVDLHWAEVRERFLSEAHSAYLGQRAQEGTGPPLTLAACRDGIRFYPWYYHEAKRIYVEHGGQYDPFNHIRDFLNPVRPDDPQCIDLPWGSLFVRYLFNKVEDVHPFADNVKPLTRYLSWAFRKDPLTATEVLLARGWVFMRAFWKAGRKSAAAALHGRGVGASPHEDQGPLPSSVAQAIDALAHWHVGISWRTGVGWVLQALISLLTLLITALFVVLAGVTLALATSLRWMAGIYFGMAILAAFLRRGLMRNFSRRTETRYLLEVARELEPILKPAGGVAYIVLGHDHRATIEPLEQAWYVNTGTWVPLYEKEGPIEGREALTFFRLASGHRGPPELLRWDDAGGAPKRLVLK